MPAPGDAEEAVADLAGFDLLTDAPRADLERLAGLMTPETAPAGAVLIRRGAAADRFLLLTAGVVEVVVAVEPAPKAYRAAAGSLLGEIAFLRHGRHSATVTALTEVRALTGDADALSHLLAVPGVRDRLLTRARQRLAAGLAPVPVSLVDGTPVGLRPVHPDDGVRFLQAAAEVSPQTVFRRFFTMAIPSAETAKLLTQLDYVDHFAWAAVDEHGVPVGGATYIRTPSDVTTAEISFSIVDDFQGRGLGTLLMAAIAVAARRNGITRFTAEVLEDNRPMRAILARAGMVWERPEDGVVHGAGPVPDPARFGMDVATAAALGALVDETALGAWHAVENP
jgi:RimJ/RimL family protein N-acetyltransferase